MGYYDAAEVPVYDHLAEEFAVCDRWFASVPGSTLPNRLYALCGVAAGSRDDRPLHVPPLYHQLPLSPITRTPTTSPGAGIPSTRGARLADVLYRLGHHQRFGYFSKTGLPWKTIFDITCNPQIPSFLEDAAAGTLPSVSWIDPAFTNFNPLGFPVNDDHPMADIKDGQDLVLAIYNALAASQQWDRSLLVIVYDEHGGFCDHVPPPEAADDDPATFGRYGVRVPAIIVSPWIEPRTVSHTVFDHTSIIKTILLRFCAQALDQPQPAHGRRARGGLGPQYPGMRVAQASHLGGLLARTTPRSAPARDTLLREATARAEQAAAEPTSGDYPLNDLQQRILAATRELRKHGHPPDGPETACAHGACQGSGTAGS